jgi:predicted dehydrogenase
MSTVTRRTFFQGATLAAAATRVQGANDRIRIGIVGLGGRGMNHVSLWGRIPECEIRGLCDVNQAAREKAQAQVEKDGGAKAAEFRDMREMYASAEIDAVSIATPNHWHALSAIWACEAGKDVYVEKPASHNIYEGRRMVEVARRTGRMVQVGSQGRSAPHKIRAMQLLREGFIGELYMARALCFKRRQSIGRTPPEPVPAGIDWDLFLGPAPMRPFTANRYKYNWHWFWDTGNGDIGNQGVHEMDLARWGLGEPGMPRWVFSSGGKYVYHDDQETPNTQLATLDYGRMQLIFEVRGLLTGPEAGLPVRKGNTVGDIYYGSEGWMWLDGSVSRVYKGEDSEMVMEEKATGPDGTRLHFEGFLKACRTRNLSDLTADIEVGAASVALCHLANISYRTGRKLEWDDVAGKFRDAPDADLLLTREYRAPYVV